MSRFEYTPNRYSGVSADMANFPSKESFITELNETKEDVKFLETLFDIPSSVETEMLNLCSDQYLSDLNVHNTLFRKRSAVLSSRLCSYTFRRSGLSDKVSESFKRPSLSKRLKESLVEQYVLLTHRAYVLDKGLSQHWDIDDIQHRIENAPVLLEEVISRSQSSYWVRSRVNAITFDSREGGRVKLDYPRQGSNHVDLYVSQDYHEVVAENLEVVNSGGKIAYPLKLEKEALPKDADASYSLFKAEVVTFLPRKIHDVVYTDADKFALLETKYICVAHTTDGKIVSCSTTPGRAVGGCNTKTKNKVLNTLEFSF